MPTYGYVCEKCQHEFEIRQAFSEEPLVDCPSCGMASLIKKIYAPNIFIKGEPTTLGHQAARNTEKMGTYEYDARIEKQQRRMQQASEKILQKTGGKNIKRTGELPWWRSGKVPGLPRKEQPISIQEAEKIANEIGIGVDPQKD